MTRVPITGCVISFNEAERIGACLDSLDFCDEILLVDSHSTDDTRTLAAGKRAKVLTRDWNGFGEQKEFAVRAAEHDWVLCLDADERVSPDLADEIRALAARDFDGQRGFRLPRCTNWLGRWIRHGTWYPDRQLRLYDRRYGEWQGAEPHPKVELDGPSAALRGDILHLAYRDLDDHLQTIDRYTTIMARGLHERGRRARLANLVVNPALRFLRFYVLKRGFLEGWRGLVLAFLAAHYVRLKYVKLLVLQRTDAASHR